MAELNIEQFNLLRSLVYSDDQLQIRPSGDFNQITLKLDYDVYIKFFHNPINPLSINNVHDLNISKLTTNKNLLTSEQWINIQNYFNKLVQESNPNTSLHLIVQLLQEYMLEIFNVNGRHNEKNSISPILITNENASTFIKKFRSSELIFNRIVHDKAIDRSQVLIGYEDRFTGIHEIKFNDFKKVHESEYGIPMHRIRYYKINECIVWDRINKIDILTGSELHDETTNSSDIEQEQKLTEGLYCYDVLKHRWVPCTYISLASDDLKTPSEDQMFIPERCQFLTWNILFDYYKSESIYSTERYEEIVKTLKSFLPDIICLQEVTTKFLTMLLDENWLKENHYYIIIMGNILDDNNEQPYGQVTLMKNFRPRAFTICPLHISDDISSHRKRSVKQYIIARFALNSEVTIDLINLHLHSNHTYNSNEKRCQSLEYFFTKMNTQNYMIIGDFNFGDYDIKEQNILQRYQHEVNDLWTDIYDLEENPGCTFDPSRNVCARITSDFPLSLRLDRYLLRTLQNLSYSIEHLNMVGLETILVDSAANKHINQSDHYALQLIITFRIRSISHRSALVVLPPLNVWPSIEPFREKYDPSFDHWPPHIKLISPFFDLNDTEDDQKNILLPLRFLLAQYRPFNLEINDIDSLAEKHISFMKLNEQSKIFLKELKDKIKQFFSQSLFNNEDNYNPFMTIGQFDSAKKQNQIKPLLTLAEPIRFPVQYIYILQQTADEHTTSFHISYQIPLGSVLEPIGLNPYSNINFELQHFFSKMNIYENRKLYQQKQDKFNQLSIYFQENFNQNTLNYFTCAFFPYGSYRLGLNGEDLDTTLILCEQKSSYPRTNLDDIIFQLRYESLALNNHIIGLITEYFGNEIIDSRTIQAIYPIISILFHDQTRVEIFVEIREEFKSNGQQSDDIYLLSNLHQPIHGVHDIEYLTTYVRSPSIFQHLLTFIRTWAKNVGFYGQVYGYLGGYSWAILCAYICHRYSQPCHRYFSMEDFYRLVESFFSTYSNFNWTSESVRLHSNVYYSDGSSIETCSSMRILCPNRPYNNASHSTINSTRYLIVQGFQNVQRILAKNLKHEDKIKEILELSDHFPDKTIESILQFKLSSRTINELNQWIGYTQSRLGRFLNDCENECNLFVQTQNYMERRSENLERFYCIGFQLNKHSLSRQRQFYICLEKFSEQILICPFRSDTMKISYKLMSLNDWTTEKHMKT